MKIYKLKFKIPPSRRTLCLGNGLYVESGDELLVMESLGKSILLNHRRFITSDEKDEVRSLSQGYYQLVKNPRTVKEQEIREAHTQLEFASDRSLARKVRARRKKIDPS